MAKVYIATVDNPTEATAGQILTKTENGSERADVDTTVTADSPNAVTSGAVYEAIGNIESLLEALL